MIGYEIIISTGVIIAFILGWTFEIYYKPLTEERERILKKLKVDHESIRKKVIQSESDKAKYIDELIKLWNFGNIRYKFENEMSAAISMFKIYMFPEGLMALLISCFYVATINNIIKINLFDIETTDMLSLLILCDGIIILLLIIQAVSYRNVIQKIDMYKNGSEITEIYSIEYIFE